MIQNTAVFKVGGGLVALGGVGTTGYIYRNEILDFWNQDLQTYLVQATTTASSKLSKYSCNLSDEIDVSCEVLKLNFNEQKHIKKQEIINSSKQFTETLQDKVFYKLTLNKNKIKADFVNGTTEIEIKNVDGAKTTISKLKIISNLDDIGAANSKWDGYKLLVKANAGVATTATLSKCLTSEKTKTELTCTIYEFQDVPSNKNSLDFSKINKITDLEKVQAGRYYIIDFSTEATNKEKLNTDINIANIFAKDSSTEKTSFSFVAKIFAHIEAETTNYGKNQGLILSDNFTKNANHNTFIIAKTKSDAGTTGFVTANKNYKCNIETNKNDTNCELIELKDTEKTLFGIRNAETLTNPTTLVGTEVKYFKIVANNDIINAITAWDETKEIKIIDTTTSSTVYKKMTPLFLIENGKVTKGKTKLAIATFAANGTKYSEISTLSSGQTYKCKVGSDTSKEVCEIYKLPATFNSKEPYKQLSSTLTKSADKAHWVKDSSFLIYLKNNKKFDSSPSIPPKNVTVSVTIDTADKELATLNVNAFATNTADFSGDVSKLLVIA